MENKIIFEKNLEEKKIVAVTVSEEVLSFSFEDGSSMHFGSSHDQDCCESVYADFSIMKYHVDALTGQTLYRVELKRVVEMGFLIVLQFGGTTEKIFIPCYNYQNGYYSSNLSIVVTEGDVKTEVDISDCVEDHID